MHYVYITVKKLPALQSVYINDTWNYR